MKATLVPILSSALLLSLGALVWQHQAYKTRLARQEQAIALVQGRYDALLEQSRIAARLEAKRALAHTALASAAALAPRYRGLNRPAATTSGAKVAVNKPARDYKPVTR